MFFVQQGLRIEEKAVTGGFAVPDRAGIVCGWLPACPGRRNILVGDRMDGYRGRKARDARRSQRNGGRSRPFGVLGAQSPHLHGRAQDARSFKLHFAERRRVLRQSARKHQPYGLFVAYRSALRSQQSDRARSLRLPCAYAAPLRV